jgi:hypothetical protein
LSSPIGMRLQEAFVGHDLTNKMQYPHALEIICMAAFMVYEKQNEDSFWLPFLESLPLDYNLPVCWPLECIEKLLVGTALETLTRKRLEWLRAVCEKINNDAPTFFQCNKLALKDLIWAYCSITSRAFPKSSKQKSSVEETGQDWITISEICLYPVLDMLNHKRNFKIEWIMSDQGVSFVSRENIPMNTEVFNNYGPKGNENLLSNYGFVIEDNSEDYVKVTLGTKQDDPFLEFRTEVLEKLGLLTIHLLFVDDTSVPENFAKAAQVMVANEMELKILNKEGLSSLKTEIRCLEILYHLLAGKLSLLKSTAHNLELVQDQTLLHLTKIYRAGQERILKHHLKLIHLKGKRLLRLDIYTPLSTPFFLSSASDLSSYAISVESLNILSSSGNENPPDEFIMLAFLIVEIGEYSNIEYSNPLLDLYRSYTPKRCKKLLGTEEYDNFKDFYESEITPLLKKFEAFTEFGKTSFLKAFTIINLHGSEFPSFLIEDASKYKDLLGTFFE